MQASEAVLAAPQSPLMNKAVTTGSVSAPGDDFIGLGIGRASIDLGDDFVLCKPCILQIGDLAAGKNRLTC